MPRGLGAAGEDHFGEAGLGLSQGASLAFFLPVVDDFCGLVEQLNALSFANPGLLLKLGFHLLPRIMAGPKEVRRQGTGAFADDLVNGEGDIFV